VETRPRVCINSSTTEGSWDAGDDVGAEPFWGSSHDWVPDWVLVGLELEGDETAGHGDCVARAWRPLAPARLVVLPRTARALAGRRLRVVVSARDVAGRAVTAARTVRLR
jgi:hypothetical protein